jgi:predicted phage-related endonuclease
MTIIYHTEFDQGSGKWVEQRCGMITSSQIKMILTPGLKVAENDNKRKYFYELLAQRITRHVEPQYVSDSMLRGKDEEILGRDLYSEKHAPVAQCGFVTNDEFGFNIGYSPDGLVGDAGLIEVKSRRQAYQIQTIVNNAVPDEFVLQIQAGLLVTRRKWCDFISYSGGMPMFVKRVEPDAAIQAAIIAAATGFEANLAEAINTYAVNAKGLHPTERRDYEGEILF